MRFIRAVLKFVLFVIMLTLSLVWMLFFGVIGVAAFSTFLLAPLGVASFGIATMPLFAALGWMGLRRPATVVVNVQR